MEMKVIRNIYTQDTTIGVLTIDTNPFTCYTLEDRVRLTKVATQTAIPAGRYRVIITMSLRFKKLMPLLLNVPGFDGIRIHKGNTDQDTDGCLLLGSMTDIKDLSLSVALSSVAFDSFLPILTEALQKEDVWITISDTFLPTI